MTSHYLIWSNEHAQWWRPGKAGYTRHIEEAGRYSRDEAAAIVENSTVGGLLSQTRTNPVTGETYQQFCEVMVLAPEEDAYERGLRDGALKLAEELTALRETYEIVQRASHAVGEQQGGESR